MCADEDPNQTRLDLEAPLKSKTPEKEMWNLFSILEVLKVFLGPWYFMGPSIEAQLGIQNQICHFQFCQSAMEVPKRI